MLVDADLHIHSRFSIGTSRSISLPLLESGCLRKGISVLGSGDAFQREWRRECLEYAAEGQGVLLVPSAEVEDARRIHHLILMEDFDSFASLAEFIWPRSPNLERRGRPRIEMGGAEIAFHVHEHGGLVGPAHAFTPWTSLYAACDSLSSCYGEERIDFLELGLSADSSYGACISELRGIPFLSNSDAHSAKPHALGREWNRLEIGSLDVKAVLGAIKSGNIVANAGLFPELGKYNRTACSRCYRQYSLVEAMRLQWRCPADGGRLKKGVSDRVMELSDAPPSFRPPYLHLIPLISLIGMELGIASQESVEAQALYERLLEALGNEIGVLTTVPIARIAAVNKGVADAIRALREERIAIHPGGGGRYGRIYLEKSKDYQSNAHT
ncbi:MAG: TIGR00375 family protein [Methanomicrobiales archaeon]|nr:TIGR00375 family protein [Methanomicrobiales archaeon]